jgi:hypothetical protein
MGLLTSPEAIDTNWMRLELDWWRCKILLIIERAF